MGLGRAQTKAKMADFDGWLDQTKLNESAKDEFREQMIKEGWLRDPKKFPLGELFLWSVMFLTTILIIASGVFAMAKPNNGVGSILGIWMIVGGLVFGGKMLR